MALNDSGKVVGTSQTANGNMHAFLFQDLNHNGVADPGEMTDIDTAGSYESGALSINSGGIAVGGGDTPSKYRILEGRHFRKRQTDRPEHPGAGRYRGMDSAGRVWDQRRRAGRRLHAGANWSAARVPAGSDCAAPAVAQMKVGAS